MTFQRVGSMFFLTEVQLLWFWAPHSTRGDHLCSYDASAVVGTTPSDAMKVINLGRGCDSKVVSRWARGYLLTKARRTPALPSAAHSILRGFFTRVVLALTKAHSCVRCAPELRFDEINHVLHG